MSRRLEGAMAAILGVHGIGQQLKGEETLKREWLPALKDGLTRAGAELSSDDDLMCAFYGDLFRREGTKSATLGGPLLSAEDVQDPWEVTLLQAWWEGAATIESARVPSPN